jgi:hypothetical protein
MKNLILFVLFVLSISFTGYAGTATFGKAPVQAIESISDIERIEWVCIDNQWYKIIYYTDGGREIYPVSGNGVD